MESGRRAILGSAAAVLSAGCVWTSRWETGDRPENLIRNETEEDPPCEEWTDEPGNVTAEIRGPAIVRDDRNGSVVVTLSNDGPGDECFVADVVRVRDNETIASIATRIPPKRRRQIPIQVAGSGVERFRLGNASTTDEVLLVPDVAAFGERRSIDGLAVTVEDLVFRGAVEYQPYTGGEPLTLSAPAGEIFAFVDVRATGDPGGCACFYGDTVLVTQDARWDPITGAEIALQGVETRVRHRDVLGRIGEPFVNRTVGDGETAAGWIPFQLPASVAQQDPLVRIEADTHRHWAPE